MNKPLVAVRHIPMGLRYNEAGLVVEHWISAVRVMDFIPSHERNRIEDGTSQFDCTQAIQAASDYVGAKA